MDIEIQNEKIQNVLKDMSKHVNIYNIAKESNEFCTMLYCLEKSFKDDTLLLSMLNEHYCYYAIGDGVAAQSYFVLKHLFSAKCNVFSIDPIINLEKIDQINTVEENRIFKCKIEDFDEKHILKDKIPILLFQHSHAYIVDALLKFRDFEKIIIVNLPCCVGCSRFRHREPDFIINQNIKSKKCEVYHLNALDIATWIHNFEFFYSFEKIYYQDNMQNWDQLPSTDYYQLIINDIQHHKYIFPEKVKKKLMKQFGTKDVYDISVDVLLQIKYVKHSIIRKFLKQYIKKTQFLYKNIHI